MWKDSASWGSRWELTREGSMETSGHTQERHVSSWQVSEREGDLRSQGELAGSGTFSRTRTAPAPPHRCTTAAGTMPDKVGAQCMLPTHQANRWVNGRTIWNQRAGAPPSCHGGTSGWRSGWPLGLSTETDRNPQDKKSWPRPGVSAAATHGDKSAPKTRAAGSHPADPADCFVRTRPTC